MAERVSLGPLDVLSLSELLELHREARLWAWQANEVAAAFPGRQSGRKLKAQYVEMAWEFAALDAAILRRIYYLRAKQGCRR